MERPTSNRDVLLTVVLSVIVWIFSAGMLWQKVNDIATELQDVKTDLHDLRAHEANALFFK